jgi:hypothetical protein
MNTYVNVFQHYVNYCTIAAPLLISAILPLFMFYVILTLDRQVKTLEHSVEKYKRKYFTLKESLLFKSENEQSEKESSENESSEDDDMPELVDDDDVETADEYADMPHLLNSDGTVYDELEDDEMPDLVDDKVMPPLETFDGTKWVVDSTSESEAAAETVQSTVSSTEAVVSAEAVQTTDTVQSSEAVDDANTDSEFEPLK